MRETRAGKVLEVRTPESGPPEADIRILTYGVVDTYGTSWKPGVFTRSIEGGNMPACWSHDPARPIGVVTDFRDDGEHLDGTLQFLDFAAVPDARMAYESMKRGAYPGISFAFERQADEDDEEHRGATRITDADMVEISPVLRASVPGSRPLAVRSDEQIPVTVAADLLAKFATGQIDLADALMALKSTAPVVVEGETVEEEKVPDTVSDEFPDYKVDADPVEDALEALVSRAAKTPYGNVKYADTGYQDDKVKRYPIDTKEHAKAAWSYINQEKNASKYDPDELATIKSRIKSALKKFGVTISE